MKGNRIFWAIILSVFLGGPSHADNFAVLLGSCPPWKHEGSADHQAEVEHICSEDVQDMSFALASKLDVPIDNQTILLQKEAKLDGFKAALKKVSTNAAEGDTVYVYVNTHGGLVSHLYKGYPVRGEVFALYTEKKPANYTNAVNDGVWMSARILRDLVSEVGMDSKANIVLVVEACHSGASFSDVVHNPLLTLTLESKMATIFSAGKDQLATFNDKGNKARFTENFTKAIVDAKPGDSLTQVFRRSQQQTHHEVVKKCMDLPSKRLDALLKSSGEFNESCLQEPTFYDPKLLLDELVILE
jgi:hypothetical protein